MVNSQITGLTGVSDNAGAIIHGQNTNGTITLQHALDAIREKGIKEDAVNLKIDLNGGHGYSRPDLANHYVFNGVIRSVEVIYREEAQKSSAKPEIHKIDIDIDGSDLDADKRRATIFYDGDDETGHRHSTVTFSKALENYCKTQAGAKRKKLQSARGGHARESRPHVDRRA